jgi:hypothetical protein
MQQKHNVFVWYVSENEDSYLTNNACSGTINCGTPNLLHPSCSETRIPTVIADSTLHHWCKLFSEQGEQAFPGSGHQIPQEEEIRHLKRENEVLRQERDILKKAIGIFSRVQV